MADIKDKLAVEALMLLTAFHNKIVKLDKDPRNKYNHRKNLLGAKWNLLLKGGYLNDIT